MNRAVLFRAATDKWETPHEIKEALYREFALNVDPCLLEGTVHGLALLFSRWEGKRVFCTPPYGPHIGDWLRRGCEAEVAVFLLPARTETRWFHELCLPAATEMRFLKGLLKFGGSPHGAPFPSMVVIIEGRRHLRRTARPHSRGNAGKQISFAF